VQLGYRPSYRGDTAAAWRTGNEPTGRKTRMMMMMMMTTMTMTMVVARNSWKKIQRQRARMGSRCEDSCVGRLHFQPGLLHEVGYSRQ